ncbi:hypothetical protein Nepgr_025947 [Nepenthes gracilis]|uniref:Uncharacterized protein n=1 Tax=Nepenthes gracilis TaxID=150966 RepID=A0AAD3Y1K6_NEPGR|nr:hypothetical protein Nepgr_025947 [Nepenthes gracilis]
MPHPNLLLIRPITVLMNGEQVAKKWNPSSNDLGGSIEKVENGTSSDNHIPSTESLPSVAVARGQALKHWNQMRCSLIES